MKNITDNNKKKSNNRTSDIVRDNIAIDLAINGLSVPECAQKYGMARQSINRWLRNDPTFVNEVERYKNDYINQKIDAINRLMVGVIDDQVNNIINISKDPNVPPSTRLDASKYIVNKFIPDRKGQSIRNQTNMQINVDNTNNGNNRNIEEILKSLDDNIIEPNNKDDDF